MELSSLTPSTSRLNILVVTKGKEKILDKATDSYAIVVELQPKTELITRAETLQPIDYVNSLTKAG